MSDDQIVEAIGEFVPAFIFTVMGVLIWLIAGFEIAVLVILAQVMAKLIVRLDKLSPNK